MRGPDDGVDGWGIWKMGGNILAWGLNSRAHHEAYYTLSSTEGFDLPGSEPIRLVFVRHGQEVGEEFVVADYPKAMALVALVEAMPPLRSNYALLRELL